jgi:hypothetical protein
LDAKDTKQCPGSNFYPNYVRANAFPVQCIINIKSAGIFLVYIAQQVSVWARRFLLWNSQFVQFEDGMSFRTSTEFEVLTFTLVKKTSNSDDETSFRFAFELFFLAFFIFDLSI